MLTWWNSWQGRSHCSDTPTTYNSHGLRADTSTLMKTISRKANTNLLVKRKKVIKLSTINPWENVACFISWINPGASVAGQKQSIKGFIFVEIISEWKAGHTKINSAIFPNYGSLGISVWGCLLQLLGTSLPQTEDKPQPQQLSTEACFLAFYSSNSSTLIQASP